MTPSKYICIASSIFLLHVLFSSANEGERNISIPPAVQNNNGLTLKQCFEKAVQQSETLKIQGENVAQSKARYQQATSGILPTIKWNWTNTTQDTSGVSTGSSGGDQTLARRAGVALTACALAGLHGRSRLFPRTDKAQSVQMRP